MWIFSELCGFSCALLGLFIGIRSRRFQGSLAHILKIFDDFQGSLSHVRLKIFDDFQGSLSHVRRIVFDDFQGSLADFVTAPPYSV